MKSRSLRSSENRLRGAKYGELANALGEWLRLTGLNDDDERASVAVDLVDVLAAADHVSERIQDLLKLDPRERHQADQSLTVAAEISVYLFEELKVHLKALEGNWERLLKRLDEKSG